ncbi:MAG: DUF1232 domain-containing protein [Ideonella sp.]|jgi:uncharacterized membrane protein YkvA (DUF1232 family)|nr:DUF1232 domain-containing protein [Ideonella sp.]MBL0151682.1 DUF1232 domain-containing protein [Ideonella sp.]MBL0151689.1 DUF1232 domain-containing protein [Ideonella sp.]
MWKRLSMLWSLVKGDARLLWHALQHPRAPGWLKLGSVGVLLYLLSPVDLIPDVIPVIGLMDDLVLVPLVIHWMLKHLPPEVREHAQRRTQGHAAQAEGVVDMEQRTRRW